MHHRNGRNWAPAPFMRERMMIRHTDVGNMRCSVGSVSLRANRYTGGRLDRWAFVVSFSLEEVVYLMKGGSESYSRK